ncbi:unnamed protein product [Polarella glacialis]|uniref:Uncharacterized protein n=1 Tax=Polarella glacialis TaxID=89957 RepID=A0A813GUA3_POLGL|nr:unnamed protein product [Polarella glacialis]
MDMDDLRALPGEFLATFKPSNVIAKGYPWWTPAGDTGAFFVLFFDNLATQLSLVGMAIYVIGIPAEFVWRNFMGGVGVSIFVGNLYYSLQASKVAMQTGKMDTCAQPYGINTPGAIVKTFGVLLPAFFGELAAHVAWSIACCANFLGALVEVVGAFIAPVLARNVPQGALLVSIGGVGMTYLGVGPLAGILESHEAHNPIVGFLPFLIIFVGFYGTRDKFCGKNLPTVGIAVLVGFLLNLLAQTAQWEKYSDKIDKATTFIGWNGLSVPDFRHMSTAASEYSSIVIGLAMQNFLGTYSCNISARRVGDRYSPMESMIVDGLGSMIGALLGSPYGTTVYIGHVVYKPMGATRGYSLLNGLLWLLFGLFGFHAVIDAILPHEIFSGVLVVVGFAMAAQTIESVPKRWYPATLIGLAIMFSEFITGGMGSKNIGMRFLASGHIFISLFYTFFLMMLTDRWFLAAAGVFICLFVFSFVGLIHAEKLSVEYDQFGSIKDQSAYFEQESSGMPGWKFLVTYAVSAAFCAILHLLQRWGYVEAAEAEDYRMVQLEAEMKEEETAAQWKDEHTGST